MKNFKVLKRFIDKQGSHKLKNLLCRIKINLTYDAMKNLTLVLIFFILSSLAVLGQSKPGWNTNLNEIKFLSESGAESQLDVDPGFRYAEFKSEGRVFRFFFNRNQQMVRNVRIIDEESKLQVARGRGSWFWGNARMEFIDGENLELKIRRNRNGYTIIGPYGPLFLVENQKIKSPQTYTEKDMLAQAFFVFDRVRTTREPINNIILITSSNSN
jgi:hypothetical protein